MCVSRAGARAPHQLRGHERRRCPSLECVERPQRPPEQAGLPSGGEACPGMASTPTLPAAAPGVRAALARGGARHRRASRRTARGSAPPSPAARTPATCAAMGAGGERQPRHWAARYCQYRCARGAAHRGSGRVAPEAARHAQMRSARHPAPPAGAPAADRAAALWQLCCRIGTTTTIACPVVDSRARCHRVQMATVVERGANA